MSRGRDESREVELRVNPAQGFVLQSTSLNMAEKHGGYRVLPSQREEGGESRPWAPVPGSRRSCSAYKPPWLAANEAGVFG